MPDIQYLNGGKREEMNESSAPLDSLQQLVRAYWKLICILGICGVLGAALFLSQRPPVYRATAEIVTGTYSLPSEVGTEPAVDKAGPLGLELPAETQARIIASPSVADIAADALGLGALEAAELPHQVSADPTTDNTFSVRVEGPSPEEAASRANAVADAYLQYRQETGKRELEALASRANELASDNVAAARALDAPINTELREGNSGYASVMLTRRQELERTAATAGASAAAFSSAAESFDGGGSVLRPASSRTVTEALPAANVLAFGLAAGLLVGLGAAALRRQFGNVKVGPEVLRRQVPGLFVTGSKASPHAARLAVRALERTVRADALDPRRIMIRPLGSATGSGSVLMELVSALAEDGKGVVLEAADGGIWKELHASRSRSSVPLEWDDAESGSGGILRTIPVGPESIRIYVVVPSEAAHPSDWTVPGGTDVPCILLLRNRRERIKDVLNAMTLHSAAGLPVLAAFFTEPRSENGHRAPDSALRHSAAAAAASSSSQLPSATGGELPAEADDRGGLAAASPSRRRNSG